LRIVGINIHPDDVEISCGGTVAKYSERNHEVVIVNLAKGLYLQDGRLVRHEAEEKACEILGAKPVFYDFKPDEFWYSKDKVESVIQILKEHKPDIVLCPKPDDPDPHHRQVAETVTDASRWVISGEAGKDGFYVENYWYQTPFQSPDVVVDISQTIGIKVKAILEYNKHKPEKSVKEIVKGIKFWAAYRGNCCGVEYAEAFKYIPLIGKPQWAPSELLPVRPKQLMFELKQDL